MTKEEFSQEFDILYNNVSSNQAPGLTEYEKSVFLTKAQDEIIKNYFTNKPNGNKYQEGIEDSAKRYSDFSCLITVAEIAAIASSSTIDKRGQIINLPTNLMISLNERFSIRTGTEATTETDSYQVLPITLQEYQRLMSKPSGDPLKRQVWKLMGNSANGNGSVEIISHWKDSRTANNKLIIRYVRRPYPIILEPLTEQGLTINGQSVPYGNSSSKYSKLKDGETDNYYIVYTNNEGNKQIYSEIDASNKVTYQWTSATVDAKVNSLNIQTDSSEACELAKELHPEILQRAVELAKIFYIGQPAEVINSGQRSE